MKIEIYKSRSAKSRIFLTLLFISSFALAFFTLKPDLAQEQAVISARLCSRSENFDIDAELQRLLEEFYSLLPSEIDTDDALSGVGFQSVAKWIFDALSEGLPSALSELSAMLGICLILSLCESGFVGGELSESLSAGVSGILSIPLASSVFSIASSVGDAISSGCDFFGGMIPIATAATALSGAGTSAAAEGAGMSLALGFVSNVLLENLLPIVSLMLAFSMASAFDTGGIVGSLASSLKGILLFVLGFISFLLPATLSFQSVISSAHDSMALRSAKYAVGNMIPIVGGTLSSMLSTLVTGAALAKGTVGALSSVAIGVIFISPLISLLLLRLAYKISISFLDFVGVALGKRVFSSLMGALDAMIAVLCMSGVIFFLETVIFMKSTVAI